MSQPPPLARIDWSTGGPRSAAFDDIYYDAVDGRAESAFVFLAGVGLEAPAAWPARLALAETGFGLGLNMLLACAAAAEAGAALEAVSFERAPPSADDLRRGVAPWPDLAPFAERLIAAGWPPPAGFSRREVALGPGGPTAAITLAIGDARELLPLWAEAEGAASIDIWWLDGFAPAKNPEMWEEGVLAAVGRAARPGCRLATFTAAGRVRRGLEAAGFSMRRAPGYGRKRERLLGVKR